MRKFTLFLVSVGLLFSCSKDTTTEFLTEETHAVSFQISTFTQSINDWDVQTKNNLNNIQLIRYAIYEGERFVSEGSQASSSPYFGFIGLTLPAGDYRIVVVATSLPSIEFNTHPSYASAWLMVNQGKNEDVFAKSHNFNVNQGSESNTITLDRLVGRLDVVLTDSIIPSNVTTIRLATNASSKYAFATNSIEKYGQLIGNFPISDSTRNQRVFSIYTLKQDTCWLQISALDFQNTTIASKYVNRIQIQKNKKTILKGSLFAPQQDSVYNNLIVNDIWTDDNIELTFE